MVTSTAICLSHQGFPSCNTTYESQQMLPLTTTDMECKRNKTLSSSGGSSSSSSTTTLPSSSSSSSTSTTPSLPFSCNNSFSHQTPILSPNKSNTEHVLMKHINHSPPPPPPQLCNDHTALPNNVTPTSSTLFQRLPLTIATKAPSSAPSSEPPLVTTLNLSSHHSHKELHLSQPQEQKHPNNNNTASKVEAFSNSNNKNNPFQDMACSSDSLEITRFLEFDGNTFGDRRNKRMMKNRESAARSRARKQAYTFELQKKVKELLEENARLKRQHQQLYEAAAIQQKGKPKLHRTSTAPF